MHYILLLQRLGRYDKFSLMLFIRVFFCSLSSLLLSFPHFPSLFYRTYYGFRFWRPTFSSYFFTFLNRSSLSSSFSFSFLFFLLLFPPSCFSFVKKQTKKNPPPVYCGVVWKGYLLKTPPVYCGVVWKGYLLRS